MMTLALKRGLKVKEFEEYQRIVRIINKNSLRIAACKTFEERLKLEDEIETQQAQFDQRLKELIAECYDMNTKDIDDLQNSDFTRMFKEVYENSVGELPKNLEQPLQKPSSSETGTPQK
jgi:hypothetical protein